eukprot:g30936.t1
MVPWPGGVEQDFLEVPSMALEKFTSDQQLLQRELASWMAGESVSRIFGVFLFDLLLHSQAPPYSFDGHEKLSIPELYRHVMEKCTTLPQLPNINFCTSWYHIYLGYDAGYYGYGWADVYAADIFATMQSSKLGALALNWSRTALLGLTQLTPGWSSSTRYRDMNKMQRSFGLRVNKAGNCSGSYKRVGAHCNMQGSLAPEPPRRGWKLPDQERGLLAENFFTKGLESKGLSPEMIQSLTSKLVHQDADGKMSAFRRKGGLSFDDEWAKLENPPCEALGQPERSQAVEAWQAGVHHAQDSLLKDFGIEGSHVVESAHPYEAKGFRQRPGVAAVVPGEWPQVGDAVEGKYFSGMYYPAKVASIKAGITIYTLDWEDGDVRDKEKRREDLRPRGGGPVPQLVAERNVEDVETYRDAAPKEGDARPRWVARAPWRSISAMPWAGSATATTRAIFMSWQDVETPCFAICREAVKRVMVKYSKQEGPKYDEQGFGLTCGDELLSFTLDRTCPLTPIVLETISDRIGPAKVQGVEKGWYLDLVKTFSGPHREVLGELLNGLGGVKLDLAPVKPDQVMSVVMANLERFVDLLNTKVRAMQEVSLCFIDSSSAMAPVLLPEVHVEYKGTTVSSEIDRLGSDGKNDVVVKSVRAEGPAQAAGVRPGWAVDWWGWLREREGREGPGGSRRI